MLAPQKCWRKHSGSSDRWHSIMQEYTVTGTRGLPWTVRPATDAEATVYRSRLAEFAEEADQLLVVPVNVP